LIIKEYYFEGGDLFYVVDNTSESSIIDNVSSILIQKANEYLEMFSIPKP